MIRPKYIPHILVLHRNLPSCPVGTKFIKSLDGNQYYNIPEDSTKQYVFTIEEILMAMSPILDKTFFVFENTHKDIEFYNKYLNNMTIKPIPYKSIWRTNYGNWLHLE